MIGVFDSGVGGLTVLRALHARLPGHDFLYVGDTARVPYGRKPPAMVEQFARDIAGFLLEQKAQALVIACNTASSAALPQLAEELPVPVWGVIEPGVAAARAASRGGRTGIIGTKGTIASGVYQRKLEALGLDVWAQACPLFVHLVEEGLAESPEAELLARHYLAGRPELDTLILGCTHYPVLREVIRRVIGPEVHLVDSAEEIAKVVSQGLPEPAWREGSITHYVTGDALAYEHTARVIGGVEGPILELAL
ncbi:MAG: glutamate racemase [Acidobacteriota bacterium]|nr:glutamate racemase [Acidobacteriota bacterium]